MATHDELKQLMERLRSGDPEAARIICDRYRDIVCVTIGPAVTGTRLGQKVSISDVVQTGMIQMWEHLDSLVVRVDNIPAYLRRMARNKLAERLRGLKFPEGGDYQAISEIPRRCRPGRQ